MSPRSNRLLLLTVLCALLGIPFAPRRLPAATPAPDVVNLVTAIQTYAKTLENSPEMRRSFDAFRLDYKLPAGSVSYSDYTVVHLLYEATRDAGFWGLHWSITDKPPNSNRVWAQWSTERNPSFIKGTATAECDELSALYAFLAERAGVHGMGLFWPYSNHTVAVWALHPAPNSFVRVVVPTSQIFLTDADDFGTKAFNPWTQKTIYEYTRRDVPDSFAIPQELYNFFIQQLEKYGGASDDTLQKIRYARDAVFRGEWTPEQAARAIVALRTEEAHSSREDSAALQFFAQDMRQQTNQRP